MILTKRIKIIKPKSMGLRERGHRIIFPPVAGEQMMVAKRTAIGSRSPREERLHSQRCMAWKRRPSDVTETRLQIGLQDYMTIPGICQIVSGRDLVQAMR